MFVQADCHAVISSQPCNHAHLSLFYPGIIRKHSGNLESPFAVSLQGVARLEEDVNPVFVLVKAGADLQCSHQLRCC